MNMLFYEAYPWSAKKITMLLYFKTNHNIGLITVSSLQRKPLLLLSRPVSSKFWMYLLANL